MIQLHMMQFVKAGSKFGRSEAQENKIELILTPYTCIAFFWGEGTGTFVVSLGSPHETFVGKNALEGGPFSSSTTIL